MKTIFSSIFLTLTFIPLIGTAQIRMSGMENLTIERESKPVEFVRKEIVVTKTMVEKSAAPIILKNDINNSEVYGNSKGITVNLTTENEANSQKGKQIVIDLGEAKKEMNQAGSLSFNESNRNIFDSPNILGFVYFDVNSDKIKSEYQQDLRQYQEVLNNNPDKIIQIVGHSDSKASEYGNSLVAASRAKSVYDFLMESDMDPNRFEVTTSEENFFKVPSNASSEENNQSKKNRSVSLVLTKSVKTPIASSKNESNALAQNKVPILKKTASELAPKEEPKASKKKRKNEEELAEMEVVKTNNYSNYGEGQVIGFIFFDENSTKIKQQYYAELFKLNAILEKMPNKNIVIVGHGDVFKSEIKNPEIGKSRSKATLTFLTDIYKMNPDRFELYFEGENNFEVPKGNTIDASSPAEKNKSVTIILK